MIQRARVVQPQRLNALDLETGLGRMLFDDLRDWGRRPPGKISSMMNLKNFSRVIVMRDGQFARA